MSDALVIERLSVSYRVRGRDRAVLRDVSLRIGSGEAYGLVGESGCGKSTVALAAVRYLPPAGRITRGAINIAGADVVGLDAESLRLMRSSSVSMVYQDPTKALNPTLHIGTQLSEVFEENGASPSERRDRSIEMLERVRIADASRVIHCYPHQLSGGTQQRVIIAMALAKSPALLILDEPTTGLDATVEAEVLDLICELRRDLSTATLLISHNLAVVSRICDRVGVLYAGMIVEEGPTRQIFEEPCHPYTGRLLHCVPLRGQLKTQNRLDTIPGMPPLPGATITGCAFADRCSLVETLCLTSLPPLLDLGGRLSRCHFHERARRLPADTPPDAPAAAGPIAPTPVLEVENVSKTFYPSGKTFLAIKDVSLTLAAGETLGLVGESGSGKSTLARILLGLLPPDPGGTITLAGEKLAPLLRQRTRDQVNAVQIVFQNPDSTLNPSKSLRKALGRSLRRLGGLKGSMLESKLLELAHAVRISDSQLSAKPRQLSGGLKQRAAIARAFAGTPKLVVCDEPTSALDVSVQAAIVNLLVDLQTTKRVAYLFISHDLAIVRYLADKIAVMYLGRVMQIGPSERVFSGPQHPYTETLLSAQPTTGSTAAARPRPKNEGHASKPHPTGCVFHARCARKIGSICEMSEPPLEYAAEDHALRCHIPIVELARLQGRPSGVREPPQFA